MKFGKTVAAAVLVAFSFASCSTTVRFRANAPDATLRIDGRYYGTVPTKVRLSNFLLNLYEVEVEAEGYEPYEGPLDKEFKLGPALFFWLYFVPLLWSYGPRDDQYFVLEPRSASPARTAGAVPVPDPEAPAAAPARPSPDQGSRRDGRLSLAVLEFKIDPGAETAGLGGRDLALLMETYVSADERFELKDRLYLKELIEEKELQATDLFDPAFAGSLGSLRGPSRILIGQAKKMGDGLTIFVKVVDVESGTQSRVFERSDILVGSRGVNSLKDALREIAAEISAYYRGRA